MLLLRQGLGRLISQSDQGVAGNYFPMAGTFRAPARAAHGVGAPGVQRGPGGGESSERAWSLFYDIGVMIDQLEPETMREPELYNQMLAGFSIMADQRRDRLSKAGTTLPAVM